MRSTLGLFSIMAVVPAAAAQSTAADTALRFIDPPCADGAMAIELTAHGATPVLSWIEPVDQEQRGGPRTLRVARLLGDRFSAAREVTRSSSMFANWADFPSVVEGEGGALLAHWLRRSAGGGHAYDVELARSVDDGETWTRLGKLHDDETATEHGFVSIVPEGDAFRAIWLDGRATAEGGPMSLRSATIGEEVGPGTVIDDDVCSCCQTDLVHTARGPIAVYRDHAAAEIRDVSLVRRSGEGWSTPRSVHDDRWVIAGCPVNGPAAGFSGGDLAVAWFTAAADQARVKVAFSGDCGDSFGAPVILDDDRPIGRVAITMAESGAVVAWLARSGNRAAVSLRLVTPDGEQGETLVLGKTGSSRSSGFPRMVRHGDELVVAWRDTTSKPRVRVAVVPLAALR